MTTFSSSSFGNKCNEHDHTVTNGEEALMFTTSMPSNRSEPAKSISTSKKMSDVLASSIFTWNKVMMLQWRQRRWTQH